MMIFILLPISDIFQMTTYHSQHFFGEKTFLLCANNMLVGLFEKWRVTTIVLR